MSIIKPEHAALKSYYETLKKYAHIGVSHEGATETAFSQLLHATAKLHHWDLIPKQPMKVAGGRTVIPDGTLRDEFNLPRGYWEAKDTADDLKAEIKKKIDKKYPLKNTIFEDTQRAVLYQNNIRVEEFDLTNPQQLADLLNRFFAFAEPDIEGFAEAVEQFKERVPELANGLNDKIKKAHADNKKFQQAFAEFFELCQTALNPNIRKEAVDEMLIQHLLTERLFRTIFDDDEFTRRNVIAAEVEKVIDALVSRSFSRTEFLKSLDKFYKAIEGAAATIDNFNDKQHFLNTVYERFFQGYSVKTADTHGIVYTPQPIVDFMCASVEEVLKSEFGLTLGSKGVNILDPCTGTGNFIVNLLRRIPKKDLPRVYKEQLFANEVMLLPYYIAALNIEHAYAEIAGAYEPFEGLCFVDTLELAEEKPHLFSGMDEKNSERVEKQKNVAITVVIGNPPYNANQVNENDENKNRAYPVIDGRIKQTYAAASSATLKNKLYDSYVKFIRWATDRLQKECGIICFISNHSFVVDQPPFDGLRKQLESEFDEIYFLDLNGNVRQNPKLSGTTHNVFGIQTGVGISLLIRTGRAGKCRINYHSVPTQTRREDKLSRLTEWGTSSGVTWKRLKSDVDGNWLTLDNQMEFRAFLPLQSDSDEEIFEQSSTGAKSNRDEIVYGFDREELSKTVEGFIEAYNREVDRLLRVRKPSDRTDHAFETVLKWSSTLKLHALRGRHAKFDPSRFRRSLYRPFTILHLYYDALLNDRPGLFRNALPTTMSESENRTICCTNHSQVPFVLQISNAIANEAVGGRAGTCFPFYVYDEDGTNRRENITDWALKQFQTQYKSKTITKWDIFYYVYGLLHHPGYRTKFADNLKRELPRIPFAPDFKAFAKAGQKLAELHLNYEKLEPHPLRFIEKVGVPLSYVVTDKMKLSKDKTSLRVNDSLTLEPIPPAVFNYRLGNRSALEWVIDQYHVTEDARSGIKSDPNREDDPEYIVRLVGQVVKVSLETVKIVEGLPGEFS